MSMITDNKLKCLNLKTFRPNFKENKIFRLDIP